METLGGTYTGAPQPGGEEEIASLMAQLEKKRQLEAQAEKQKRKALLYSAIAGKQNERIGGELIPYTLAGRNMHMLTPRKFDLGGAIGKVAGSFMANRAGKKAEEASAAAQQETISNIMAASGNDTAKKKMLLRIMMGDPTAMEEYKASLKTPALTFEQQKELKAAGRQPQRSKEDEIAIRRAGVRPPAPLRPHISTSENGDVTLYNDAGEIIKKIPGAGAKGAGFKKDELARQKLSRTTDEAITELERISADGGLIDQSTGSGIGAAYDAGARVFGKATPGNIAVGQLNPIYDLVLKMVPRFEGPQSDKDTISYRQAAGQLADPQMPNDIKKAAAKEILRLMKARRNQFDMKGEESAAPTEDSRPPLDSFGSP